MAILSSVATAAPLLSRLPGADPPPCAGRGPGSSEHGPLGDRKRTTRAPCPLTIENLLVEILAVRGLQRLAWDHLERPGAVRPPFRAQEQRAFAPAGGQALRERVQVRDKKDFDAALGERRGNLPRDLRALPLVRRRERLVEQHEPIRVDPVGDVAHPAELFVEFAAL